MENYRDIKLITMEAGKKNLVSKPSYDTTKLFFRYFISNSSEKNWHTQELTSQYWKQVPKIVEYEILYDYVKP